MCVKEHIYPLLASHRRKLGMSQQELAARAGLRREKVNRIENSGQNIGFNELCRLIDVLGLEIFVYEKGRQDLSPEERRYRAQSVHSERQLEPQEFHKASFIDASKAKILKWGKVPK